MTMIDEEWLAGALSDLSSAVEVPSDGPARVLAARGAVARGVGKRGGAAQTKPASRSKPSRRRLAVAVGMALASIGVLGGALVVAQPSGGSHVTAGAALTPPAVNDAPSVSSDGGLKQTPSSGAASTAAGGAAPGTTPALPSVAAPALPTRIIKTGTVELQVGRGKLSPTVDQLTVLASGLGGYVATAKTTEGGGAPAGDLTLRVPVHQFETLLGRTRALGRPTSVSTSGQDVTAAYVDLDARIQALQATRTQYLQILSKATAIGDILSVEQQLGTLQGQIEQLQGQQKVLADQSAFGTLAVHLSEPGSSSSVPQPQGGLSKAWDHARHSFSRGVEAVVGASGGVLVFLVFAALLALALRLAWPVVRRRLV